MTCRYLLTTLFASAVAATTFAQPPHNRLTTFFVGRLKYAKNSGNDCSGVGRNMIDLVSQVSTVPVSEEKKLTLTDPELFKTPFLFMNGHDDFVFSAEELATLRIYFEHGGFLFASGCCTNPAFPRACRRELARVFPNASVRALTYDHSIYRAFYRIEEVRNLHENRRVHLEGLYYGDRLVAILCEDGLCCAFSANNRCNVGRGVSPEDGKKLALNIAVYAMTH